MHCQVDLSKSTSTQHFSNSIKIELSLRSIFFDIKGVVDLLHDIRNLLRPGTEFLNLLVKHFTLLIMLLDDALSSQQLAKEGFLVDVTSNLPDLSLILLRYEWTIDTVNIRQISFVNP